VQLAFIHAFMGNDNDSTPVRMQLGLQLHRHNERLSDLPLTHFTTHQVTDAEAGDLLILSPRPGDRDRAWHTIIIVEHTISGTEHRFVGDASWGNDLYGEKAGGIARRTLVHDTRSGEWWDVHPIDGSDANRNTKGPYAGHPIKGLYRAKQVAVTKKAATRQPAREAQEAIA
jgi:hypothetical protein